MRRIAQYSVVKTLGKGQFGTVYLAVGNVPTRIHGREAKRRVVALKSLHDINDARSANLLIQEFSLLAQVKHRCIVQVHEYLSEEKTLVMEYVHGVTLREVIDDLQEKKIRFPSGAAIEIACEIADALFQAFTSYGENSEPLHLVHRDLKPANIILTPNGEVKVLDFGLARVNNSEFAVGRSDQIEGTPIYMSPEQAQGLAMDHRSDLFSLGLILYELLIGEPAYPLPFGSANPLQEILRSIAAGRFTFTFEQLERKLPSVGTVLRKVLQANPDRRYRDGRDLQFDLRAKLPPAVQETALQQFSKYYFHSVKKLATQPTYESLEAELSGLHRAPSLNEALRSAQQSSPSNQGVPNNMTKPPSRPPSRPPKRQTQSNDFMIPQPMGPDDDDIGGDATSFIAIKPKVSKNPPPQQGFSAPPPTAPQAGFNAPPPPPSGGFSAPPPQQGFSAPPPTGGFNAPPPSISSGGQTPSFSVGMSGSNNGGYNTAPPSPNSDVVQTEELSGSLRVPIMLLSAVGFVCLAAIAVIYFLPSPEPEKEAPRITEPDVAYLPPEPTAEPEDVAVVVEQPIVRRKKVVKTAPKKPKVGSISIAITASSNKVLSINATCGAYRKRAMVSNNKASFTGITGASECKLKFNPGGGTRTVSVGANVSCTVSGGSTVACK